MATLQGIFEVRLRVFVDDADADNAEAQLIDTLGEFFNRAAMYNAPVVLATDEKVPTLLDYDETE